MISALFRYFFVVLVAGLQLLSAHGQFSRTVARDTSQATITPDSTQWLFTNPIPRLGSVDRLLDASEIITDSAKKFIDYRYVPDLLTLSLGIWTREFGYPTQMPDMTLRGLGARAIAFLNDGVRLNEPLFGTFNPYDIPTEHVEQVEHIPGTQAFLYGLNATGGTINFISKNKKAIRASSQLRYSESAHGYSVVDGMVSQDIIRGLNVTAGAQHTTFGPRFQNSDVDAWNARVKIRYNVNSNINVFFSEIYNQSQLGLNSGIDILKTPDSLRFDRLQAIVRNSDAYEKITRHDLQIGGATRLLCDTNAITMVVFSLSSHLREFRDEENRLNANGIFLQQDQRSQWMGITLRHHHMIGLHTLDGGIEFESQQTLVTPATENRREAMFNMYGKLGLQPLSFMKVTSYARFDRYLNQHQLSYGTDGILSVNQCLDIIGGYSRSFRFPTIEERFGLDTLLSSTLSDESIERHHLLEAGFRWKYADIVFMKIITFHRTILKPIVVGLQSLPGTRAPYEFKQLDKEILQGCDASLTLRVGSIFIEGTAQFLEHINHDDEMLSFPKWTATGGVYYWDKLFDGHLNVKAGVRGRFFSEYISKEFNQQALVNLPDGQQYPVQPTGIMDIVLIAHLGDAYVHFAWDNFLDKQYIMTSFYPMTQRAIRFGVNWEFTN